MLTDGHTAARASLSQIRGAANILILQCAGNSESPQGGIATNIGIESKARQRRPKRTCQWGSIYFRTDM